MAECHPIFARLTRGTADFLLQFSLIACRDSDVEQFFLDHIPLWQSFDAELTHPPTEAHHANH